MSARASERRPRKSLFLAMIQSMPRSTGVMEPSVSCPTMMKPISARSTCIVSVPYGVMANFSPAAITASHTCRASLAQTLISYASSPEKLIRITRAGTPAAVPSRAAMKGNASGEKSIPSHTDSTTLQLSGPTTAAVAQWSVTDVR